MSLYGVEIQREAERLLEIYREAFKQRCGELPITVDLNSDMEVLRWTVINLKDRADFLIRAYLRLDDDWVKNKGFPLSWFKNNVNAVIAAFGEGETKSLKPVYVCGYSQSGYPGCSNDPNLLKKEFYKFKPMLWDDWVNADIAGKLQRPREKWEAVGNDVGKWIELWKREKTTDGVPWLKENI